MLEYKYVQVGPAKDNNWEECAACRRVAPLHEFTSGKIGRNGEKFKLCDLCAQTDAGNAHEYPNQYENAQVLKHICAVANLMLDKITGRKPG